MMNSARQLFSRIVPIPIANWLTGLRLNLGIRKARKHHERSVSRLRNQSKIKVAFFLINVDSWKLDSIYWAMWGEGRFEPVVVICPFLAKGQAFLDAELRKAKEFCKEKNYNFIVAYNESHSRSIDIKEDIKPDIVFFTNPNKLTSPKLQIFNYLDTLTCFVPYSFRIDRLYKYEFDNALVNLTWLNFFETSIHKQLAIEHARNQGCNVVVSGFPFIESFDNRKNKKQVWKRQSEPKKKIIWAPHWTLKGYQDTGLDWSCFLIYHEAMLGLASEYESKLQFAMKPHPFLKKTLSQSSLWGADKTENYFRKWQALDNCQLVEGDYVDLFADSDALIHDSGSFMTEFLSLNKPIAYTQSEQTIEDRFNEFGKIVLGGHVLIRSERNLREFVLGVINGSDSLRKKRQEIIAAYNLNSEPPASSRILAHIKGELS
jgi:hypothetical protein